jgi:hypothetical protein
VIMIGARSFVAERKVLLVPDGLNGERVDAAVARMLGIPRSRVVELGLATYCWTVARSTSPTGSASARC